MVKIEKKQIIISVLLVISIVSIFMFTKKSNNQSIKIGTLLPLTKSSSQYGVATKQGIDMCIDEINNSGGINGRKIECIEYDDEGDPSKSVVGYNYLKDKGVSGIITGVLSDTALAIVDQARNDQIPLLMTTASADEVTFNKENNEIYENVFRIGFTNSFQGEKIAEFSKSKNVQNASVLFCAESEYSSGLKDSFVKKCNEIGINVSTTENFPSNAVDFQKQLENIKSKNPDMLFIPYYRDTISLILPQINNLGLNCLLTGPDGWRGVTTYLSDTDSSKLKNCFYCDLFAPDDSNESSKAFFEKYKTRYNEEPNLCSACGYNASLVLKESIKKSLEKNLKINSDDFRKEIVNNLKTADVDCVSGNISFDKYHNPKKPALIIEITDGKEKFYKSI